MIDLAGAVGHIAQLAPGGPLPEVVLPAIPDLGALAPLAGYLGTDPRPIGVLVDDLLFDSGLVASVVERARPLIDSAQGDLVGIAGDLLARAAPLVPQLISGNPALMMGAHAQLGGLIAEAAEQAGQRAARLTEELLPLAQRLDGVADPAAADGAPPPPVATEAGSAGSSGGTAQGEAAVAAARSALGTPYAWGGTSLAGFDCSGLTQWAWRQAGVELPRLAEEQSVGRQVSAAELAPGDLVVWDGHVAMYAGNGEIIEAGDPVQINPLRTSNMGMAFQGFYRPTG